jgi:predicted porin
VPLGAVKPVGRLRQQRNQVNGTKTLKANGFGLGATYALSKRTRLYAGYRTNESKTAAGVKQVDTQRFAVGVRHDF